MSENKKTIDLSSPVIMPGEMAIFTGNNNESVEIDVSTTVDIMRRIGWEGNTILFIKMLRIRRNNVISLKLAKDIVEYLIKRYR